MKHLLTRLATALALPLALPLALLHPAAAGATPFCPALEDRTQLPDKLQQRGPFHTDTDSGWIIGQDQLKDHYAVSPQARHLLQQIRAAFDARGIELVVLAAPPRPMFAPRGALTEMGLGQDGTIADMGAAFSAYIAALNAAGITAPDLGKLAADKDAAGFYFKRDTHWTPMGAALSVAHLEAARGGASVADNMARLTDFEDYTEKGSLAGVVAQVCGTRPAPEHTPAPVYAAQGDAASLLGDAPARARIALVGTSFSDRYQRDAYQVAGALAFMAQADVAGFALSGGGMTGAMEAFILNGDMAQGGFDTVVWEVPYSTPLTQVDGLRQILGALQIADATAATVAVQMDIADKWHSITHSFSTADLRALQITTPDTDTGTLVVELVGGNGEKQRVKLVKSKRLPAARRSTRWTVSLDAMPAMQVARIKIRLRNVAAPQPAIIAFAG